MEGVRFLAPERAMSQRLHCLPGGSAPASSRWGWRKTHSLDLSLDNICFYLIKNVNLPQCLLPNRLSRFASFPFFLFFLGQKVNLICVVSQQAGCPFMDGDGLPGLLRNGPIHGVIVPGLVPSWVWVMFGVLHRG